GGCCFNILRSCLPGKAPASGEQKYVLLSVVCDGGSMNFFRTRFTAKARRSGSPTTAFPDAALPAASTRNYPPYIRRAHCKSASHQQDAGEGALAHLQQAFKAGLQQRLCILHYNAIHLDRPLLELARGLGIAR